MEWTKIEPRDKLLGCEVLGVKIRNGAIVKVPFITYWSRVLDKFYGDPTHYILMPQIPRVEE